MLEHNSPENELRYGNLEALKSVWTGKDLFMRATQSVRDTLQSGPAAVQIGG